MRRGNKVRQITAMLQTADDWTIERTYCFLYSLVRFRENRKNIGKGLTNGCSYDRIRQTTVRRWRDERGRKAD